MSVMNKRSKEVRILIVDDEPEICRVLRDYLGERGFDVDSAGNGSEALDKVKKSCPGLIILDEIMPVMPGFQFLKKRLCSFL